MSDPIRVRSAARGWATRASKALYSICKATEVDKDELSDALDEFDRRIATLDEAQSHVELEIDEQQLESDIEAAADFRSKTRIPRILGGKLLAKLLSPSSDDKLTSESKASVEAKLPKLVLPKFSGEVTEWTTFWDQFCVAVDNRLACCY